MNSSLKKTSAKGPNKYLKAFKDTIMSIVTILATIVVTGLTFLMYAIYLAMVIATYIQNESQKYLEAGRRTVPVEDDEQASTEDGCSSVVQSNEIRDESVTIKEVEAPPAKPDTINDTFKYWRRRHTLFSKFNHGVMLDEESFYSVCPEVLSSFMAEQCSSVKIAIDPFCGAGGNIIQLAKLCDKVIAVDVDPEKIQLAKHNASIYGVYHKIDFIVGDFFKLGHKIKGDVLVTSPPWGGPSYNQKPVIEPSMMLLDKILEVGRTMAPKLLLHLPKNLNKYECLQIGNVIGVKICKMENVFIDKYLNSLLVYVRSINNDSNNEIQKLKDIHLRNSFRKNDHCRKTDYTRYLMDVQKFLNAVEPTSVDARKSLLLDRT